MISIIESIVLPVFKLFTRDMV